MHPAATAPASRCAPPRSAALAPRPPQVVQVLQLGNLVGEEDLVGDVDLARVHARDPMFGVNPSVRAPGLNRWG